jgi:hypothetical protein
MKKKPVNIFLIVFIPLFFILACSLGFIFVLMDTKIKDIETSYSQKLQALNLQIAELEEKNKEIERLIAKTKEELGEFKLETKELNQSGTTKVLVFNNGQKIVEFSVSDPSEARIIKNINNNLYIGILPKNLGALGYETFKEIYQVDLEIKEANQLRIQTSVTPSDLENLYFNDISNDEKLLAYVVGRTLYIDDIYSGENKYQFQLSDNYYHIGGVVFSPDNSKIALGATSSYKQQAEEKSALIVIDLNSSTQTEIETANGGFYNITSWQNSEVPEFELLNFNSGL